LTGGAAVISIAVASDLHAHTGSNGTPSPSHLNILDPPDYPNQHPITGLLELIRAEGLTAHGLVSPGDLGDKANQQATKYAWNALHDISRGLKAEFCTATAGNHDIDSRYLGDDHAPEHILKALLPQFPLGDEQLDDRYWARAYAIRDYDRFRLLLLNSSAYHGHTPTELNHGRIDKQTLEDIRKDLNKRGVREINVLLCHHHPQQHSELGLGEHDVMKQGQLLLDLLGSADFGRWLIIHGHKHHPKITYAAGSATSPIVFSAGSLCSTLFLPVQTVARNQFYIIDIDPKQLPILGLAGRIRAWDWATGSGWLPANERSGLPHEFGFGFRGDPIVLADQIASLVSSGVPLVWDEVRTAFPYVDFVLPQDMMRLESRLIRNHSMRIVKDRGRAFQLGKMI
jgi:hypothetical protein